MLVWFLQSIWKDLLHFYRPQTKFAKVMFSQVCPSVRGGVHGRLCAWPGGGACMAGETATAAGGTRPTGMHSCGRSVACFTKNIIVVGLLLVNWTTKAHCWLHDT